MKPINIEKKHLDIFLNKKENFDMSDAYCCVLGQMKKLKIW